MQPTLIYITVPNREEAILLSRELVGKKLAACANIIDHVTSLYWWDGEIDQNNELIIIVKTLSSYVDQIVTLVKQLHSYDCPAILAVPVTGGNNDYIEWISKHVTPDNS